MVIEESLWIKDKLQKLDLIGISAVLNIGSSTGDYRKNVQPYIEQNVFLPLKEKGIPVFHLDNKNGEGVDFVGNIEKEEIMSIVCRNFDLVICTNMLEHVCDINASIHNIVSFA